MKFENNRIFDRAIEKRKESGYTEIYFLTVPGGFKNNAERLEYWHERGYQAEITDSDDGYGILHVWW